MSFPSCFCSEGTCLVYLQENAAKFRFLATNRRHFKLFVISYEMFLLMISQSALNLYFHAILHFFHFFCMFRFLHPLSIQIPSHTSLCKLTDMKTQVFCNCDPLRSAEERSGRFCDFTYVLKKRSDWKRFIHLLIF